MKEIESGITFAVPHTVVQTTHSGVSYLYMGCIVTLPHFTAPSNGRLHHRVFILTATYHIRPRGIKVINQWHGHTKDHDVMVEHMAQEQMYSNGTGVQKCTGECILF